MPKGVIEAAIVRQQPTDHAPADQAAGATLPDQAKHAERNFQSQNGQATMRVN